MDSLNMDTMVHFVIKRTLTKKNILYDAIQKKIKIKGFAQTWSNHASIHLMSNTMEDPLSKDLTHIEK